MARNFDSLIKHLLDEIALCGEQGATVRDVFNFVKAFYEGKEQVGSIIALRTGASRPPVNVDRAFFANIWGWLAEQPRVHIERPKDGSDIDFDQIQGSRSNHEDEGETRPPLESPSSIGPAQSHVHTVRSASKQTHEAIDAFDAQSVVVSNGSSTSTSSFRIRVGEERIWNALTGHEVDWARCPRSEFTLLTVIAATRERGITQPELQRRTTQDMRSIPRRADALHNKGYIVKRPIYSKGSKTSHLVLRRFADTTQRTMKGSTASDKRNVLHTRIEGASGAHEDAIDTDAIIRSLFDLLGVKKILTYSDLKNQLGIADLSWHLKVCARLIRKLEIIGCVRRVLAVSEGARTLRPFKCVKLLREPVGDEWNLSTPQGITNGGDEVNDLEEDEEAIVRLLTDHRSKEAQDEGSTSFPHKIGTLREVQRSLSQWTPDRGFGNLLFDFINASSTSGISTMASYPLLSWRSDLRRQSVGTFFRRPFENVLDNLAESVHVMQPHYLRHLAVVRDLAQARKSVNYQYYTYEYFKDLVESGHATWEAIEAQTLGREEKTLIDAAVDGQHDESSEKFDQLQASLFRSKNGRATVTQCALAAEPSELLSAPTDPTIEVKSDGTYAISWSRGQRRDAGINQRSLAEPSDTPKRPIGRPRKYPKGEEPYKRRGRPPKKKRKTGQNDVVVDNSPAVGSNKRSAADAELSVDGRAESAIPNEKIDDTILVVGESRNVSDQQNKLFQSNISQRDANLEEQSISNSYLEDPVSTPLLHSKSTIVVPLALGSESPKIPPKHKGGRRRKGRILSPDRIKVGKEGVNVPVSTSTIRQMTSQEPLVSIDPPGSAKMVVGKRQRGRPKRAMIAVFRSQKLHEFLWFTADEAKETIEPKSPHSPVTDEVTLLEAANSDKRTPLSRKRKRLMNLRNDSASSQVDPENNEIVTTEPHGTQHREALDASMEVLHFGSGLQRTPSEVVNSEKSPSAKRPAVLDKRYPSKRLKITQQGGGSLNVRRRKLILDLVNQFGGVFPGDRELWYAYCTKWMQENPYSGKPDTRTVLTAQKALLDGGQLNSIKFAFNSSKGPRIERRILLREDVAIDSYLVRDLQNRIKEADGEYYLPPEAGVTAEIKQMIDHGHHGPLRKKPKGETAREFGEIFHQTDQGPRSPDVSMKRRPKKRRQEEPVLLTPAEVEEARTRIRKVAEFTGGLISGLRGPRRVAGLHGTPRPPVEASFQVTAQPSHTPARRSSLQSEFRSLRLFEASYKRIASSTLIHPQQSFHRPSGTFGTTGVLRKSSVRKGPGIFMPRSLEDIMYHSRKGRKANYSLSKDPMRRKFDHEVEKVRTWEEKHASPTTQRPSEVRFINHILHEQHNVVANGKGLFRWNIVQHATPDKPPREENTVIVGTPRSFPTLDAQSPTPTLTPSAHIGKRRKPVFRTRSLTAASTGQSTDSLVRRSSEESVIPRSVGNFFDMQLIQRRRNRPWLESVTISEDEMQKLVIAVVVVRTLTGGIGRSIDWVLVVKILPQYEPAYIQQRWNNIHAKFKGQMERFQADFQRAFIQAYEANLVPPIDYDNLLEYDWDKLMKWALEHMDVPTWQIGPHLPAKRKRLDDYFEIKEGADALGPWKDEYFTAVVPAFKRLRLATGDYRASGLSINKTDRIGSNRKLRVAKSWIRANVVTPEANYDAQRAWEKLSSLDQAVVDQALEGLSSERVITHTNKGRLMPGRNFDVTEQFLNSMRKPLDEHHFDRAVCHKAKLDMAFAQGQMTEYSSMADDAEVMVTMNLLAGGQVRLVVGNQPADRFGLLKNSYKSRNMDKSLLFMSLKVRPTSAYVYGNPLSPFPPPPRRHLEDESLPVPLWYDIHGNFVAALWRKALAAVLAVVAVRAGVTEDELATTLRPSLQGWELRLIMDWLVAAKAGLALEEGWTLGDWWWMAVEPEVP
ncbi:MAG: RNA polymerase III transcription initiation factor complex subunit [Piccolia ochrophora]|nr:MAG: RNA polymerase III transcription initiation factor complex subunit [Piccolia ochrophora]